jgi:hypothetical protein
MAWSPERHSGHGGGPTTCLNSDGTYLGYDLGNIPIDLLGTESCSPTVFDFSIMGAQ